MKKQIFLTGGHGFIGRHLQENLNYKYDFIAPTHKELNLENEEAVSKFLENNSFDVAIHAANIGGTRTTLYVKDAVERNLRMFFNIIKNKSRFKKIICFGSGAEYDKRFPLVKVKEKEFGKRIPVEQYGFYKYICSLCAKNIPQVTILRLFGVFGKYEDSSIRFISQAILSCLADKPIIINKNVKFDYLYVNDLVKIVDYFIEHETREKIFNAGSGETVNLITIAEKIKKISGKKIEIICKEKGLQNEYTCDVSLLKKEVKNLNYTSIGDAIRQLLNWYQHTNLS